MFSFLCGALVSQKTAACLWQRQKQSYWYKEKFFVKRMRFMMIRVVGVVKAYQAEDQ
jgi:hypothetical protein